MKSSLLMVGLVMATTLAFASAVLAQADTNCDDYPTQAAAQAALDADPSDPNNLDADDDQIACEDSGLPPGGGEETMMEPTTSAEPTMMEEPTMMMEPTTSVTPTSAAPDSAPLPATGGSPAAVVLGSVVVLVGGGLLAAGILRRS